MGTIHEQEKLIFEEYQKLLGEDKEVSTDGLHYLGEFYYANGYWGRDLGSEEAE